MFTDAAGVHHAPATPTARIACLVPSITELLFALGLQRQLVARTHYCVHPANQIDTISSVGGTKKIKLDRLAALAPSHVIVNIDETPRDLADALAQQVPHVIVTHPQRPEDNLALYRLLGGIFGAMTAAERLCEDFNRARQRLTAAASTQPKRRALYLIWQNPWMTVARNTYIAQTLALAGWDTYPAVTAGERGAERYPVIDIDSSLLEQVDRVLFSSEPFQFTTQHLQAFADQYHCRADQLALIDGEMTSWYGSRAIAGLDYLRNYSQ